MTVRSLFKRVLRSIFNLDGLRKFYLVWYVLLLSADVIVMYVHSVSVAEVIVHVFFYVVSWLIIQFIDHKYLQFVPFGIALGVLGYMGVPDFSGRVSDVGLVWILVNFIWIVFVLWTGIYLGRWLRLKKRSWILLSLLFLLMCGYIFVVWLSLWCGFYNNPFLLVYTGVLLGLVTRWFEELVDDTSQKRPEKVSILGVKVGNWNMDSCIREIGRMVEKGGFHRVVTPYSEFFLRALSDSTFREVLDTADISVPDGIFIHWAATYLSIPISKFFPVRILCSILGYVFSGASIIFYPEYIRMVIESRVSGSDLIYPLCEMAAKKKYSVFFVGGFDFGKGNSGILAADILRKKYKGLNIAGIYPGERKKESREEALREINKCKPDIVCVCFGGGSGEMWAYENRKKMKCKAVIGLGGTFDFVAGYADKAPAIYGKLGLEWFVRPFSKESGGLLSNISRGYRAWWGMLKSSIIVLVLRIKSNKEIDL